MTQARASPPQNRRGSPTQLRKLFRLLQMFPGSDSSEGEEQQNAGVSSRGTRGGLEAGRSVGNEKRQLAGSAEVNS